jgi:hypothetical protein
MRHAVQTSEHILLISQMAVQAVHNSKQNVAVDTETDLIHDEDLYKLHHELKSSGKSKSSADRVRALRIGYAARDAYNGTYHFIARFAMQGYEAVDSDSDVVVIESHASASDFPETLPGDDESLSDEEDEEDESPEDKEPTYAVS